jgi:hypothetical protein
MAEELKDKRKGINDVLESIFLYGFFGLIAVSHMTILEYISVSNFLKDKQVTQEKVQSELDRIDQMSFYAKMVNLGSRIALEDYLKEQEKK